MIRLVFKSIFTVLFVLGGFSFGLAQTTTVTFNEITTSTGLSLNGTNTYDNSGIRFQIFSGSNSNAWVSSTEQGLGGTRALDDNNTAIGGVTGWRITKVDGTAFQLNSIWLQNGDPLASASGTVKAYKSGAQVGATVNVNFDSNTTGTKSFAANPDFYDVDEIRIEGTDLYVYIDNFSFGTAIVPVDSDPPVVTGISLVGAPLTTATSVNYTVTFSKNAKNISTDDFQLTTAGTIGTVASVSSSIGTSVTVTVNGIDGEGTIRLDLKAGTNIANDDNTQGTPAYTSGQLHYVGACFVETFETETDAATTFSGNGVSFSLGTGFEIEKKAGFGAGGSNGYVINNNTAGSFSLTGASEFTMSTIDLYLSNTANSTAPTGTGTITITGKKGGADQYTITKNSGFPTTTTVNGGFFTINFATDGAANYRNTNVDELVFTIGGGFIELAVDNMNFCEAAPDVDSQAPVVQSIIKTGNPLSTSSTVNFQVTFDEAASNVTIDDFTLLKTGTATGTITGISGSGSVYTLTATGISGEGSIQVKLNAATDIEDALGNNPPFEYLDGEIHLVGACYIETFETFADGVTTFSSNGKGFTLGGNWAVQDRLGFGINSSDVFLENTGSGPYSFSIDAPVKITKLALFLTSNTTGPSPLPTNDGTVTIRGKSGATTAYTITKSTGFPTDFTSNNGYFYIDFATEGGADNSNTYVDGLEIEIGGAFVYLALDNLEFCSDFEAPSGYSVVIDQDPINAGNSSAVSFTFADAEIGATYNYTFSTSGGATTVTGSGTIASATDQITGIDLSGLEDGTITLSVTLTDPSGNTGDPATDTSVKAPNNIPVATAPSAPVVTEDEVNVALADDIQVADADGDDQTLTFTITGGTVTLGIAGITFAGSGNGSASFTAAGTLAALNTALDAATFTPTPDLFGTGVATIEFVSNDGTADSDPASVTFNITGVNDAPVFDGNRIISYTEGGTATKFNGGGNIGLSDIEGDDIIEAKITFNDKITGDVLSVEAPNPYSVTQEGDVITLSGTGSVAQMIAALESIEYSHIGNDPTVGGTDNSRLISTVVKDASGLSSNILTVQVALTAVNNDPSIASLPTDITVQENAASNVNLSAATFGDPDAGANSITLEIAADLGILTASDGGGVTISNSGTGAITLSGAAAAIDAYFNTASNIQYTGPVALSGDNAATLTFTANDGGNTGTGGGTNVVLGTVNVDISNAPPTVTLSVSPSSKPEGVATDNLVIATLSNTYDLDVTVNLAFSGTATHSVDYIRSGATITIPAGSTTGSITFNNIDDNLYETNETVIVDITLVTYGTEDGVQQVTFTITEDDLPPTVSLEVLDIYNPITDESGGQAYVRAKLSAVAGVTVSVPLTFSGTATGGGTDYSITGSTISISSGDLMDSIRVTSLFDGIEEGDETIIIDMGTPTNGTEDGIQQVTLTIIDEDAVPPIGYSVEIDQPFINAANESAVGYTFSGAEVGATYNYTFSSDGGGTNVSGSGTIVTTTDQIAGLDLSGLADGTITLSVTLEDGFGNTGPLATDTKIKDTQAPAKPGLPDLVASSDSGISDTDDITNDVTPTLEGTAENNSTVSITSSIDGTLGTATADGSGQWSFTPGTDLSTGVHSITASISDIAGNSNESDPLSLTIDTKAPTPVIINGLSLTLDVNGDSPTLFAADFIASPLTDDFSDAADIVLDLDKTTFNCSNVGSNLVRITATDEAGNSDYAETYVLVQDNIAPTAIAKNIILNVDAFGTVTLLPSMIDDGSSDNCSIVSRTLSKTEFDRTDEGPNNVTLTVFDGSGNSSSAIAVVTVVVVPKILTITADPDQSKLIGAADPVFTYSASGFEGTDDETILTGALSRDAGETVGTYAINQGDLSAGSNYSINFVPADFEIKKGTVQITGSFDAADKVYDATKAATISVNNLSLSGIDATVPDVSIGTVTTEFVDKNVGVGKEVRITSITLTGADAGSYDIDYTGAPTSTATISAAPLSVVGFSSNNKVYDGTTIASLSGTSSVTGIGADDVSVTGTPIANFLQSDVGVAIPITVTGLTLGGLDKDNYLIIPPAGLEANITKAQLLISANPNQSKEFGSADPIFTYSSSGFVGGETDAILTGALSRTAGEDKGTYPINLGTLDAGSNYSINFTGANFTIAAKVLNITADAGQMKVYGEGDPIFTYVATGFEAGDDGSILTGALSRAAGENVGNYAINLGTLSAGANYTINFTGANFAITPRTLNVTANPNQAKVYGSADPVLAYSASNFGNGDTNAILTGALSRTAGENIGLYPINLGTLSAGSNYTINFTSADFEIATKILNVTAEAGQTKVFGTTDPVLTYTATGFENGDTNAILTGALSRAAGENVGSYAINLGTLNAGANYAINYVGANFAITKALITGITLADGSFVYDGTAKSLAISGTLPTGTSVAYTNNSRTDVGTQEVTATISGSNYMNLVLMADLTITPASIVGISFEDGSFVYDGTAKSLAITGALPLGAFVAYTNNSRTDVGLQEVSATISGSNFTSFELTADLEITKAILEVIADADQSKLYGEADPVLTYSASGFGVGDDENILTGTISRELGEGVGSYAITIGTLDAGSNYTIDFTGADFEIISNDTDGDGVPDDIEEEQGTDSEDPMDYLDTDGDGVPDYVEEQEGTDPDDAGDYLDSDDDLVPDYVEEQQGTDPEDGTDFRDEDGDGNPDYVQERSVTEFVNESIEALWGTDSEDLKLPTEVVVITAQGEFINLPVTWDLTGYDPIVSGTTNYLGTVDLPAGLFNPDDLQPILEITVLTKPAPQDVTLSANSFIGIPDQYFQEIGAFTVIDPTDNVHMFSLPEGLEDNEYFEVLDGILFWSSAEQAGGRTTFTVVLQVTDRAGNVLEKSFLITRTRTPLDQLDVPNTFTPNGDGSNDTWGVLALRYYTDIRITILNVGGEVVFYTENPDVQWDGVFNGKEMPVGAYLYVIEVGETDEIRRGMLNLLRR
ncbi:MBG domain-containing protein [Algoriphagus yeomjeoni]|uniref:MBG domain-containing protein n=1 Tax=Algoriphagus yeomjeoni TaxID=291403 RepID=UPI003CE47B0E